MKSSCILVVFICLLQLCSPKQISFLSSARRLQEAIDSVEAETRQVRPATENNLPKDPCSEDLLAYYPFDRSYRDVCYGYNGVTEGTVELRESSGVKKGAAFFRGYGKVRVTRLNGFKWGSNFSLSLFFKCTTRGSQGKYQGLINNGYATYGSWEIRMGSEWSGQMLGGGIITSTSAKTWDYGNIIATFNHWHHVVMSYDGTNLDYYLDNVKQVASNKACCQGDILAKNTDVVIGQAGQGTIYDSEYFHGYIDEVKLFKKSLTAADVQQLYQLKNI